MKKWLIFILVYVVLALIISVITAIPPEIDERALEKQIQSYTRAEGLEKEFLNRIPEEYRESAIEGAEDSIRSLYEYKNTFSYRFMQKLEVFGIGLIILIGMAVCVRYGGVMRRYWW